MAMEKENQDPAQSGKPPAPPPDWAEALRFRLDRAEALITELQNKAPEAAPLPPAAPATPAVQAAPAPPPPPPAPAMPAPPAQPADTGRISELAASLESLKRAIAHEEALAARVGAAEAALAELKASLTGQRARLETELGSAAHKDTVDALRVGQAAALSSLEEMKADFKRYSGELEALRSECRKALGEAQGLAKVAARNQASVQMDEFLRDSVGRLGDKMAELETAMHAGLSELAARFNANEVLYNKMFSTAEERFRKDIGPQLKDLEERLRWLRDNVLKLSDDYTVVAERRMRALEAKYSAFEAIARRMNDIDAALKEAAKNRS